MIEILRRVEQRKMDIAALAERYVAQNGNLTGFDGAVREFAEKNPLFAGMSTGAPAGGGTFSIRRIN